MIYKFSKWKIDLTKVWVPSKFLKFLINLDNEESNLQNKFNKV